MPTSQEQAPSSPIEDGGERKNEEESAAAAEEKASEKHTSSETSQPAIPEEKQEETSESKQEKIPSTQRTDYAEPLIATLEDFLGERETLHERATADPIRGSAQTYDISTPTSPNEEDTEELQKEAEEVVPEQAGTEGAEDQVKGSKGTADSQMKSAESERVVKGSTALNADLTSVENGDSDGAVRPRSPDMPVDVMAEYISVVTSSTEIAHFHSCGLLRVGGTGPGKTVSHPQLYGTPRGESHTIRRETSSSSR